MRAHHLSQAWPEGRQRAEAALRQHSRRQGRSGNLTTDDFHGQQIHREPTHLLVRDSLALPSTGFIVLTDSSVARVDPLAVLPTLGRLVKTVLGRVEGHLGQVAGEVNFRDEDGAEGFEYTVENDRPGVSAKVQEQGSVMWGPDGIGVRILRDDGERGIARQELFPGDGTQRNRVEWRAGIGNPLRLGSGMDWSASYDIGRDLGGVDNRNATPVHFWDGDF